MNPAQQPSPQSSQQSLLANHEHEHCCMVKGRVTSDVELRQVGPDLWSLFTIHGGGNSRFAPSIPNRMFVFRLRDNVGKQSLVLVNTVWPDEKNDEPFAALRRLSKELNAPIRFILNPGPEHHLSLAKYALAFPDARVCVAEGRVEREAPALCALDNVETMKVGDALPELSRQGLHVHVWDGFTEGNILNKSQFRFSALRGTAEPTLFWHEASGNFLNGGHGWFYWPEGEKMSWLFRKLLKPRQGHVTWSPVHYMIHDSKRCIDSAKRILDWKFDNLIDLHTGLDQRITGDAHGVAEELLRPLIDENWDALPFGHGELQIPEGKVTGGDWKSYR